MRFHAYSQAALSTLERFNAANSDNLTGIARRSRELIRMYAATCPLDVILVDASQHVFWDEIRQQTHGDAIAVLFQAWQRFDEVSHTFNLPFGSDLQSLRAISALASTLYVERPHIYKFLDEVLPGYFFIMCRHFGPFLFDVNILAFWWHLQQGHLPIHGAGIIHNGGLYLFLGKSGSGKSTIAEYSAQTGHDVLDEDQVLLFQADAGYLTAGAWRDSLRTADVPLRGIFNLVQSTENRLVRLPKADVAHKLITAHTQISLVSFNNYTPAEARHLIYTIAANVPGYDLHFRKSADFWGTIEAELGHGQ